MSHQLTLSSLFSALALVLLALVARGTAIGGAHLEAGGPDAGPMAVQIHTSAEIGQ